MKIFNMRFLILIIFLANCANQSQKAVNVRKSTQPTQQQNYYQQNQQYYYAPQPQQKPNSRTYNNPYDIPTSQQIPQDNDQEYKMPNEYYLR